MTETAFILGAGLGTRLRPMTLSVPKPLIPLWNRPLLAHTLDTLTAWGVKNVYINTHWLPEALETFVRNYSGPLNITLLPEPEILGTGGCLRHLALHLKKNESFWLINGDILFTGSPEPLIEAFEKSGRFAAVRLEPARGPRTVEMDYAGRITCWHSPTPAVERTYTFSGISLLSPEVIDFLPAEPPFCSVIEAFEAAMFANKFVIGCTADKADYWNDAGTLASYLQAHRDAQKLPELAAYRAEASRVDDPVAAEVLKRRGWKAEDTIIIPMGTRGSKRRFIRMVNGRTTLIAVAYETEGREENARYANCAKALAHAGIPVPRVISDMPGLLLLQDLGDETVTPANTLDDEHFDAMDQAEAPCECEGSHDHAHEHEHDGECTCGCSNEHDEHVHSPHFPKLAQVMELLAAFHKADIGKLPLEAPFDKDLYAWEVSLYENHVRSFSETAHRELAALHRLLAKEPQVLVHRDFQSTNILRFSGKPYVIDFQGMRRGPAAYDLASFLFDPYEEWGAEGAEDAVKAYAKASGRDISDLRAILPYAGIQRLIQAIGAYHRLASVGQTRFLQYVAPARSRARTLAAAVGLKALAKEI